MLLDLVSPWAAAVEANDLPALDTFRERHRPLLDQLSRTHAPHAGQLPLLHDRERLRQIHQRTAQSGFIAALENLQQRAATLGSDTAATVVLLAAGPLTTPCTVLPDPEPLAVLACFDVDCSHVRYAIHLARALAQLTRWTADDSLSDLRHRRVPWDRWELTRAVPLREWIYAEGLGWHLAQALHPEMPLPFLFDLSFGAWQRLREQEQAARTLLLAEIEQRGVGPVVRWLMPSEGTALSPMMGHYLAWRMTAPRVARMGLAGALRATA